MNIKSLIFALLLHGIALLLFPNLKTPKNPEAPRATVTFKKRTNDKKTLVALEQKNSERPTEAKYIAEFDQKTLKETTAKNGLGNQSKSEISSQGEPKTAKNRTSPGLAQFYKSKPTLDPLGLEKSLNDAVFHDQVLGAKEGDETKLNAWQWRHAPFFNRIKSAIAQIWAPQKQIERFDPQGTLLGNKDRVTVLEVTIDKSGELVDVNMESNSGVAYLDSEAERAFRTASPFPHPPEELFGDGEQFTFKFAFHLQINRGGFLDFSWKNQN